MSPSQKDARPLQQWLEGQPNSVDELLKRARRLSEINEALPRWLNEPWLAHIRVANVRDGTVVLFCASAAALVPLRHRAPELLAWLNQRFQLAVTRLETKVRPLSTTRQR